MAATLSPDRLVLRCYGYRSRNGVWQAVCLDLNLAAQGRSGQEVKKKLRAMIESYFDTVLDTNDKESIPALLQRRAPLTDWAFYYLIKIIDAIRKFPGNFTFQEFIPFHLAHNC